LTDRLGAQGAVCSGGRYDLLVEQLGGTPTPAIGWALGVERLVALLQASDFPFVEPIPDVFMVLVGDKAARAGLPLAERLRDAIPGLRLEVNCGGGSFKAQFRRADRSGAALAVVIGDNETEARRAGLKPLRGGEQIDVSWDELATRIVAMKNSEMTAAP
jgi:histidyl-tRNA synthetase